ncbi:HupE/UreJ family protein [Aureimonas populi]|uniref:HupE/UreJ family protein n=1 Tax=Aureimonas populi TaxID=1701758 RepID=A0ABW5CM57_9HYPH|nr:HupE/UreJ family protein [Aureimonas populi]
MKRALTAAIALLAATAPAYAHLDPAGHGSFMAGFTHPLFGLDHILAMVAVGLWAAMLGGRSRWRVPAVFVGTMAAGFALALAGVPLPFVEPAILASVVALGLLVAMAARVPAAGCALIVGGFALFHGHAHGGEIGGADVFGYGAGFVLATAMLHGSGIALGLGLARFGAAPARWLGAATAAAGLVLMVQA